MAQRRADSVLWGGSGARGVLGVAYKRQPGPLPVASLDKVSHTFF